MWTEIVFKGVRYKVPQRIVGTNGKLYAVQEQIGTGGNAVVSECADESDGTVYAVKFLANSKGENRLERFCIETKLMSDLSQVRHDHLIRFITNGTVRARVQDRQTRKDKEVDLLFVIMEKANSSLREFIGQAHNPIAPEIYAAQFRGLVSALEQLHRLAIHRDIKPDNILVVGERWVISDFGLCALIEKSDGHDLTRHWEIPGPRFWMSPEANNRSVGLSDEICYASDIFQLAAVFWWVVNRRHPSGILAREDWTGIESLFVPISKALQHSLSRRYSTANDFATAVVEAISV